MRLSELPRHIPALVERVVPTHDNDLTARRLEEIGFIQGERVVVLQYGPFGKNPVLIQIGYTRFALRQNEAHRVEVRLSTAEKELLAAMPEQKSSGN